MNDSLTFNEDSDKGYIIEVDFRCPKELYGLQSGLPFLPKRIQIDKCEKRLCSLYNNKNYVIHMRALKQEQDKYVERLEYQNFRNLLDNTNNQPLKFRTK